MKIYIAGPYTKGDVAQNVRKAIFAGDQVAERGHVPFIPHLTHFWHMLHPHAYEFWLEQDLAWLKECDAILRLPGESAGADSEVDYMESIGKPVFHHFSEIPIMESNAKTN